MEIKCFEFEDRQVRLAVFGDGHPLFLLHPLGSLLESWSLNIMPLARFFRVVAPDFPGHGSSGGPLPPTISALGDWVLRLAQGLGFKRFHAAGNSLGGTVCLDLASRHPGCVGKIVLVASPWRRGEALEQATLFLRSLVGEDGTVQMTFQDALRVSPRVDNRILALINENLARAKSVFLAGIKLVEDFEFEGIPDKIGNSALVIWGSSDGILPSSEGRELARRLKNAEYLELAGAGHSPQFDSPEEFNKAVIDFLKRDENF